MNEASKAAVAWLQGVLRVAWSTAADQLPRINALVKNEIALASQGVGKRL